MVCLEQTSGQIVDKGAELISKTAYPGRFLDDPEYLGRFDRLFQALRNTLQHQMSESVKVVSCPVEAFPGIRGRSETV